MDQPNLNLKLLSSHRRPIHWQAQTDLDL